MTKTVSREEKRAGAVAAVIGAPGEKLEDRSPLLRAPQRLTEQLADTVLWMTMPRRLHSTNGDEAPEDVPRFGLLSLLLQGTPCFVYDQPVLNKISRTGFTDGIHIFINADFLDALNADVKASNYQEYGLEALLMHELSHKLWHHDRRLLEFPKDIQNAAMDKLINSQLKLGYPDMVWCASLRDIGLAFRPGESERYVTMAEETIAREMLVERAQKKKESDKDQDKDPNQQGKPGQGKPGQGKPGQGKPGQGKPGQGKPGQKGTSGKANQKGQPGAGGGDQDQDQGQDQDQDQNGQDKSGQDKNEPSDIFGSAQDNHVIDMATWIKILEENGLQEIKKTLELPDSDDAAGIERMTQAEETRQNEAIETALTQMHRVGGKYPGAHMVEAASEFIKANTRGKLTWKLGLRELIFGTGSAWKAVMDEPSDPYYVDEVTDMVGTELWLPINVQMKNDEVVLVIMDTSGSVGTPDIKAFLAETLELKMASSGMGDAAAEVIVLSADTVLRGEPTQITDANMHEIAERGVGIAGRGGTDFCEPLRQAVKLPIFKEKKIKAVAYFTDLFATPPSSLKEVGLEDDAVLLFIAAPSSSSESAYVEEFAKKVAPFARVTMVEEGLTADLSETSSQQAVSPSAPARRSAAP